MIRSIITGHWRRFLVQQQLGSILFMFAIMLPIILSLLALAFDGSRLLMKKARLVDAISEVTLMSTVESTYYGRFRSNSVISSNYNTDGADRMYRYIVSHLSDVSMPPRAYPANTVSYNSPKIITPAELPGRDIIAPSKWDYGSRAKFHFPDMVGDISRSFTVKTMLPIQSIAPAFSSEVSMADNVRTVIKPRTYAVDYFILMPPDAPGVLLGSRKDKVKRWLIQELYRQELYIQPDSTFTIMPYDTGVPVKNQSKNEFGNANFGCSVLFVPKKLQKYGIDAGYDLDYTFWADKPSVPTGQYNPGILKTISSLTSSSLPYSWDEVNAALILAKNHYTVYTLGSTALGYNTFYNRFATPDVVNKMKNLGWCRDNTNPNLKLPSAEKSDPVNLDIICGKDPARDILHPANQAKIKQEFEKYRTVAEKLSKSYIGIVNEESVDVEATLTGMFDERNIINIPLYIDSQTYRGQGISVGYGANLLNPGNFYTQMCGSLGHSSARGSGGSRVGVNNGYFPPAPEAALPNGNYYGYDGLNLVENQTIDIIEQTNDPMAIAEGVDNLKSLDYAQTYNPIAGMLRMAPELLKGKNKHKKLLIFYDSQSYKDQYGRGIDKLADLFMKDRPEGQRLCDMLRQGVKDKVDGTLEIYLLDLYNDYYYAYTKKTEMVKEWGQYCTGEANAFGINFMGSTIDTTNAVDYDSVYRAVFRIADGFMEESAYFANN